MRVLIFEHRRQRAQVPLTDAILESVEDAAVDITDDEAVAEFLIEMSWVEDYSIEGWELVGRG
jgi:hypothetical protein